MIRRALVLPALMLATAATAATLVQDTSPETLIAGYSQQAGQPASPERGKALFTARHGGGKPDTPSCTTCHTANPRAMGQARTGKPIDPMAPRVNAARFINTKKVEKWFRRNCNSVLGRECSPLEKADILAWLDSL